jgi:phosphoribosylformimino-5-aminoimidazole carboxamide ribotide isomerase
MAGFVASAMFEVIPAIDLKEGKCVRLRQGDAARVTEYSGDPLAVALGWEALGARRIHLVDLDGAFAGAPAHVEVAQSIFRSLGVPVQFGGGIRSLEDAARLLDLGAARVILGTIAAEQPELVEEAVRRFGEAVAVGIDARGGEVAVRGWVQSGRTTALDLARRMKAAGVARVIYTDIARDGTLGGANFDETEGLARETGLRVIASGGVASIDDVRELWRRRGSGIEGVILGRALYEGRIDFPQAAGACRC